MRMDIKSVCENGELKELKLEETRAKVNFAKFR